MVIPTSNFPQKQLKWEGMSKNSSLILNYCQVSNLDLRRLRLFYFSFPHTKLWHIQSYQLWPPSKVTSLPSPRKMTKTLVNTFNEKIKACCYWDKIAAKSLLLLAANRCRSFKIDNYSTKRPLLGIRKRLHLLQN